MRNRRLFYETLLFFVPMSVAVRCKTTVCGSSLAEIVGSNAAEHGCSSLESVVFCQVEVCAMN